MLIAYVGNFNHPHTTETYVADALERAGTDLIRIEQNNFVILQFAGLFHDIAMVNGEKPVLLFAKPRLGGNDWNTEDTLAMLDATKPFVSKQICWCWDLLNPGYSVGRFAWASAVSDETDLFLTTDGSIVKWLTRAKVLRQGCTPDAGCGQYRKDLASDVLWLGGTYGKRADEFQALLQHFKRRLFYVPQGWHGKELADLIASAKVVIGPTWPQYPGYWSNRLYVVSGHGGVLLTPTIKGMADEGWDQGKHYMGTELVEAKEIGKLLKDGYGFAHGEFGSKLCRANFTYDHRVRDLLSLIA